MFQYGEREINYLKQKDKRLGEAIDRIGYIERNTDSDLFSSVVHHIIGQQISSKAQETVWRRLGQMLGEIDADTVSAADISSLQQCGMTFRKAQYIKEFADRIKSGEFDLCAVAHMNDQDAIKALSSLKGIGTWTAEMILLFCMERPDILSFDDLAIQRGLRMLYRHREIDKAKFERYRRRFSPYGSVASLYIWAVAGGALEELTDPAAPKKTPQRKRG